MPKSFHALLLLLVLSMVGTVHVFAQDTELPPDSVHLIADTSVAAGQTVIVEVIANVDTAAYGFGFQLQYDPSLLSPVVRPDQDGTDALSLIGNIFNGAQRVRSVVNELSSDEHAIDVVYTLLSPAPSVSGEGVLTSVAFEVLQPGETRVSLINPRLIGLNEGNAFDIPLNLGDPSLAIVIQETRAAEVVQGTPPDTETQSILDNPIFWLSLIVVLLALVIGGLIAYIILKGRKKNVPQRRKQSRSATRKAGIR